MGECQGAAGGFRGGAHLGLVPGARRSRRFNLRQAGRVEHFQPQSGSSLKRPEGRAPEAGAGGILRVERIDFVRVYEGWFVVKFTLMKLSLLSILIGGVMCVPQVYGLLQPARLAAAARRFPRQVGLGAALVLLATGWFLYIVNNECLADFAAYKPYMLVGFGAVGVLSCLFVQDFLAARGLAVLLLLLAKTMVDTGRPHLGESPYVVLFQGLAYVYVVAGIWITIAPWRLRDFIQWFTRNDTIVRVGCGFRLAIGLGLVTLGLTAFRGM